ncbi:MAG: hypothetical protein SV108_08670 [Pseudomonadota bacterium]|nr:hypothetical protein [Pseudomonadota bacterium]
MIEALSLLFLLLPLAAGSGWWLASRQGRGSTRGTRRTGPDFSHSHSPATAVRRADTADEGVEHGMALGAMFRRAGNVDQAIRIHQELLEHSGDLAADSRSRLQLELAHDYFKAGVVDRAEALLLPLRGTSLGVEAFGMLRRIYEQERDWVAAIATAREIEAATGESMRSTIAQYLCESAATHLERNDVDAAEQALQDALATDWHCIRASMMQGEIAQRQGCLDQAIAAWSRVLDQDLRYVGEVLQPLRRAFESRGDPQGERRLLTRLMGELSDNNALARASRPLLASILPRDEVAVQLRLYVEDQPTLAGLQEFIDCWCRREFAVEAGVLETLRQGLAKVATVAERYRCFSCGLSSRRLYWQCPSCKQWNSLVPAISQRTVSASAPPPVTPPEAGDTVDSCC